MTTRVFFDGQCPLCQASRRHLTRLDWLRRLEFVDFREAADPKVQELAIPKERLEAEMHVVSGSRIDHGFGAFRLIAWQLPLLWPILPLLYIPGVPWLGQKVYLWIARRRYNLIPCHGGACQIPRRK